MALASGKATLSVSTVVFSGQAQVAIWSPSLAAATKGMAIMAKPIAMAPVDRLNTVDDCSTPRSPSILGAKFMRAFRSDDSNTYRNGSWNLHWRKYLSLHFRQVNPRPIVGQLMAVPHAIQIISSFV